MPWGGRKSPPSVDTMAGRGAPRGVIHAGSTTVAQLTASASQGRGHSGSLANAGGGAGGTIFVESASLEGNMGVSAQGGGSWTSSYHGGGGSGGRVVVRAARSEENHVSTNAAGGTSHVSLCYGAAGTQLLDYGGYVRLQFWNQYNSTGALTPWPSSEKAYLDVVSSMSASSSNSSNAAWSTRRTALLSKPGAQATVDDPLLGVHGGELLPK